VTTRPRRAVLIGLDGANYEGMKPLLERGLLPNLTKLLREGTRCENAYPPYPTLTGSNWATIATGAWPGTHGVTDMSYHVSGEPVNYWHSGFTSNAVEAETLWEAAARAGKKAITLKYTGSWPPRHPDLVMVDGGGGRPFRGGSFLELSLSQLFSTDRLPSANLVSTEPAQGWSSLPASSLPPLQASIAYRTESGHIIEVLQFEGERLHHGEPVQYWALVFASGNGGYDTLALCKSKDFAQALAVLRQDELSGTIAETFQIEGRPQRGAFLVALAHVDAQTGGFDLFFSQVYPTDGFTQPAGLGAELVGKFGAYFDLPPYSEEGMGWFRHGPEIFLRFIEYQCAWLGKAGRYLMETRPCDLFATQCHVIDYANHNFIKKHGWTSAQREAGLRHLERCYRAVDRMVGELLAGAGADALVCVLSDHGVVESEYEDIFVDDILAQAGLLTYEQSDAKAGRPRVDRSKTLAETQRDCYIYVSLEGREPGGTVPAEEYGDVQDRIVDALTAYREPESGRNPFALILRKEDARILGLYDSLGRDIGDVIYAFRPGYGRDHGQLLPGVTHGGQTIKSLMIWRGPGIKEGAVVERTTWLVDVVPTFAHVMGWPAPTEAEGGMIYQILSEHRSAFPRPEFMSRQAEQMKAVRERLAGRKRTRPTLSRQGQSRRGAAGLTPAQPEALPETVEELQNALLEARAEAASWKRAYEQNRQILHQD